MYDIVGLTLGTLTGALSLCYGVSAVGTTPRPSVHIRVDHL